MGEEEAIEAKPKVHYDEIDVAACLARETEDGPGEQPPKPSDWVGFAMEGVERED